MYKGVCVVGGGVALLILSHFSSISHENEIIFTSIGYLKMGEGV